MVNAIIFHHHCQMIVLAYAYRQLNSISAGEFTKALHKGTMQLIPIPMQLIIIRNTVEQLKNKLSRNILLMNSATILSSDNNLKDQRFSV